MKELEFKHFSVIENTGWCLQVTFKILEASGEIIALDGKTICNTETMSSYKKSIHILTALA